jgi:hypothetical protein
MEHPSEILFTSGMASPFKASYNEYYSKLNGRRKHGGRNYEQGRVLTVAIPPGPDVTLQLSGA